MTLSGRTPPASLAELRDMIVRRDVVLGRRIEDVLRYLIENPEEAAFATCQSIADKCKVSISTVDRLAPSLGFHRFADVRDLFRQHLRAGAGRRIPGNAGTARAVATALKDT